VNRSYLYVPGTRPDRFDKALASGADAIFLDLEDSVAAAEKDSARAAVCAWLRAVPAGLVEIWVRVNGGDLLGVDARAVIEAGATRICLPKASLDALASLDAVVGDAAVEVSALIETAEGVLDARAIAAEPRVTRLQIGEVDLSASLNVDASDAVAMAPLRMHVVLASAAAGIDPPIAPVSTDFKDLDALRASTRALRGMGFGARAAIHPAQVAVINEAFTPTTEEVEAARALLARFDAEGGGVGVDERGRMIDEATVRTARRVVAIADGGRA
jgi:citrate lyase subunit beta/citryl-CoA lyase